jgi:hypothetical protein
MERNAVTGRVAEHDTPDVLVATSSLPGSVA